ncbi:MAG: hypothetical protein U1C73_08565, partial [Dietzia sp.]|nr:hypothetical protein [Dietzia sp.]
AYPSGPAQAWQSVSAQYRDHGSTPGSRLRSQPTAEARSASPVMASIASSSSGLPSSLLRQ